jgi:hypothetical protein
MKKSLFLILLFCSINTYAIDYYANFVSYKLYVNNEWRDWTDWQQCWTEVKLENNNLVITWNTDAEKSATTIPLSHLIDVYTVKDTTTVDMTITDNVISADVKAASIAETHLNASVNASLDLADSALQKADIATGSANGTISVEGTDVKVKGLKSAAYTDSTAYAKASEGLKSVTASSGLIATFTDNVLNIGIKDSTSDFVFILDANA